MGRDIRAASSVEKFTLWVGEASHEVEFSPTDGFFAQKLHKVFADLGEKHEEYEKQAEAALGTVEVFDVMHALDNEMREMLNTLFGHDICTDLFADRCIYSFADGLPEWCNLTLAIMEAMDENIMAQEAATNPRIEKYTKKYQNHPKYHR